MFTSKKLTIIILIIVITAVLIGLWFWVGPATTGGETELGSKAFDQLTEPEVEELEAQEVKRYQDPSKPVLYESDQGFSFRHSGLEVSSVAIPEGQLLTFDKGPVGFQIFILSFNEPGSITTDRIKQDLPGIQMDNIQYATLDGVNILFFDSNTNGLDTYEAWTVNKGRLYQILTYRGMEDFLHQVLGTWKWS